LIDVIMQLSSRPDHRLSHHARIEIADPSDILWAAGKGRSGANGCQGTAGSEGEEHLGEPWPQKWDEKEHRRTSLSQRGERIFEGFAVVETKSDP
jgi:hypothetical protein